MIVGELIIILFYIFGIIYSIIIIKNFWKIIEEWDHELIAIILVLLMGFILGLMLVGIIIFIHNHINWQIIKKSIEMLWNSKI